MVLRGARLILFDAGFTLVGPKRPVTSVYREAALAVDPGLEVKRFDEQLSSCWQRVHDLRHDAEDLRSSGEIEADGWARFTRAVAAPFPRLAAGHGAWLARLVEWFDRPSSWRVLDDVPETLAALRREGLGLGVVSNWHTALHGILEGLGLTRLLDFVLISADVGWRKPHPEIFREALRRSGVGRGDAVHVGDSLDEDVRGATAAGLRAILLAGEDHEAPAGTPRIEGVRDLIDDHVCVRADLT